MTSQNRCPFGRRTLSSCFSAWFRFDMVKTVNNFSILCKNHQWFPVAKQIKNLQIRWFLLEIPNDFSRNISWFSFGFHRFLAEITNLISARKKHTFFRISRFFPKITNDFWRQKKIFKFRWFLVEIPNDLSRNIFWFSFGFHRFRAEITNDFCNKKTQLFSEFLDFWQKSPMIYVGKKNFFWIFSELIDFLQKSPLISAGKKIRKIRGFHSIGETLPPPNP